MKRVSYYIKRLLHFMMYTYRNFCLRRNNSIGSNCKINKTAIFEGNARIGNNVTIGKNVTIGRNVRIGNNVSLRDTVIGCNTQLESNIVVTGTKGGFLKIGKESYIGFNIVLDISENITIGDYVHLGCSLYTHSSAKQCIAGLPLDNKDLPFRPIAPIVIKDNVYIGVNSCIYPGVTIPNRVIVAPNSVVTKDVQSNYLVGGVPAKNIKTL